MFTKETYIQRRATLRNKIGSGLILVPGNQESPMNYTDNTYHFRQDSTFLYFFGLDLPGMFGVIDVDNNHDLLYANDVDIEDIIWMGPQKSVAEQAFTVGVDITAPLDKIGQTVERAIKTGRRIHFTPPYRAENQIQLSSLLGIKVCKIKQYASLSLIQAIVSMRSIKDAAEIAEIELACATGYEMHVTAMKMAQPGIMEQQIAGVLEGIALSKGTGTSFPIILTQNGETLHNHNHSFTLEAGRLMIVDAGAESNGHYASDFTRTFPVGGKFSQKQMDIYNIVLAANNTGFSLTKPGVTYQSVHLQTARVIAAGLKELGLMKGDVDEAVANGAHALFFPHGLGHMLGLDVHDMEDYGQIHVGYDNEIRPIDQFGTAYLRLGRRLESGFVITNEPGIYFIPALIEKWEKEGINKEFINFDKAKSYLGFGGIRLEDNVLVTETGARLLGNRIPINQEEVEAVVASGKI
ncbi:MAG: aminopeptidase P family protein [Prolixibacteraceae bacterium]|jgi:Xaa-Pro aminopeptidase|nr:aminopeptidase P family protein [Prolixibacteraceae bacterium]